MHVWSIEERPPLLKTVKTDLTSHQECISQDENLNIKRKREGGSKGGNGVRSEIKTEEEGEFQGKGSTVIPHCGWVN